MTFVTIELLVIAALWGWWAWKDPKRAYLGLPILLPTYVVRGSLGPIPTTGLELILIATLVAWTLKRGKSGVRETWTALRPWRGPALLWLAAGLVAVIVSPVHLQALGLYRAYFIEPLLIFFVGADLVRTLDDQRKLAQGFATITILLSIWAAIQMLTGWGIPHPWDAVPGRRAVGPFSFPNALALFVTPIAALAFADRLQKKEDRLLNIEFGWATVISGLVAIILAQSDGGLIAFAAAAFIALVLNKRTWKIAVGLAALSLIAFLAIAPLRTRVIEMVTFQEWSGKVRTVMWSETWTMLRDRPVFGAGLAAYPTVILPYHKATWMEVFQYPHNIVLNLWSETGLLGLMAFAFIIFIWVRGPWSVAERTADRKPQTALLLILPVVVAILVHGLVDVPYFKNDLAIAFWMLILLTMSTHRPAQKT
ncbi:MAG TPA: O-antigen ligase family protein [Candidatus Methylomirabilis sp.]|nr:O-antigen ligase family protein [Candidatus Methylomirabilis sp.]